MLLLYRRSSDVWSVKLSAREKEEAGKGERGGGGGSSCCYGGDFDFFVLQTCWVMHEDIRGGGGDTPLRSLKQLGHV